MIAPVAAVKALTQLARAAGAALRSATAPTPLQVPPILEKAAEESEQVSQSPVIFAYDGKSRRTKITEFTNGTVTSKKLYFWLGGSIVCERDGLQTGFPITKQSVIPRVVRAISHSLSATKAIEPCPPSAVEGISSVSKPPPLPPGSGVFVSPKSLRKWGYAGLWHHGPSGLDLATYRAYDAANKRWISRDPLGEGVDYNLYRYCGNSPINWSDMLGLDPTPAPGPSPAPGWQPSADAPATSPPPPMGGLPGLGTGIVGVVGSVGAAATGAAGAAGTAAAGALGATGAAVNALGSLSAHGTPGRFNGADSREWHHLLPQQQRGFFAGAGIDIDKLGAWLPRGLHRLKAYNGAHTCGPNKDLATWNQDWQLFQLLHPNATKDQIIHHLIDLRQRYGI